MNDLTFDETNHIYYKKGIEKPSVTQILQEVGLIDYSAVPKDRLERSSNFGTAVHKTTELDDKNILDYSTVNSAIIPYLSAYKRFVEDYQIEFLAIEQKFYCEKYDYCGTIDRIAFSKRINKQILFDIKTTSSIYPTVGLQLAGYAIGIDDKNILRWGLQLQNNQYKVTEFKNNTDYAIYLSALNLWKWKKQNKLIKKEHTND